MLLSETTFIVTDIETTGLSPERNRVTEVACVYVRNGKVLDERQTLVNPEQFIPHHIQKMTGITNAAVLGAPKGAEIFPIIGEWVREGSVFVAHNVSFDYNFLQHSFRRHNLHELSTPKLCTVRLAKRLIPGKRSYNLGQLAGHFGVRVKNRHSALGDARATAEVLIHLLGILEEKHGGTDLRQMLSYQFKSLATQRRIPENVKALAPTLAALPARPGVYRMTDKWGAVLYVGKAKNLRSRVSSYFQAGAEHPKKIHDLVKRVRKIEIEETGSELGALLLESRQIKEYQPKYNTLQKRIRRYPFVRIDPRETFPEVTFASELEPDGAEYFGPFNGRIAAQLVIETIQHLFRLKECPGPIRPDPRAVPCMYYQIDRCGGPCAGLQGEADYKREVDRVRAFLTGSEEGIIASLEMQMQRHAEALEFEEAAELRDKVQELRKIFTGKNRVAESINENNVIIVLPAPVKGKREIFMVRYGRLVKQVIAGRRVPVVKLRRLIEKVYFDGTMAPPQFRKEELAEIRILASYIHRHRESGRFTYIGKMDSPETVANGVLTSMGCVPAIPAYPNPVELRVLAA